MAELDAVLQKHEAQYRSRAADVGDAPSKLALARFLAEAVATDGAVAEAEQLYCEAIAGLHPEGVFASELGPAARRDLGRCRAWFAVLLEGRGRLDEAEAQLKASLDADPTQPLALGNYAVFLHKVRRDRAGACELFEAAVKAHPAQATVLIKFAAFKKALGDHKRAEALYERAVGCAPDGDGDAAGAYAVFLHATKHDAGRASAMYERAISADPHANNLSNYGLFLSDVQGEYANAEAMYQEALAAEPDHANAAYNYAVLLDGPLGRSGEAEAMYRRVLAVDAKHAFALYNLAVLLEETRLRGTRVGVRAGSALPQRDRATAGGTAAAAAGKGAGSSGGAPASGDGSGDCHASVVAEVLALYGRAAAAAPSDALSLADLGRCLLVHGRDGAGARAALEKALALDPRQPVALFHLGLLCAEPPPPLGPTPTPGPGGAAAPSSVRAARDVAGAATCWLKLVIEADPAHVHGLRRLARLEALDLGDYAAADKHYAAALAHASNGVAATAAATATAITASTSMGPGGDRSARKGASVSAAELEDLAAEVGKVMAGAKSDKARIAAAKVLKACAGAR